MKFQNCRRTLRPFDYPVRLLEDVADVILLDGFQIEKRDWIGRIPRARARRARENLLVDFQRRAL